MLWIGITGPMGGGKSTVSRILRDLGFSVLDADAIVSDLLTEDLIVAEIETAFGKSFRTSEGQLDRPALGRFVFKDPKNLARLESILHPRVRQKVSAARQDLERQGVAVAFYDVPLLFEKGMEKDFDSILVVTAAETKRIQRLQARTGLSEEEIRMRFSRQMSPEEKEKRATVVVRNDGDIEALKAAVFKALQQLNIQLPT